MQVPWNKIEKTKTCWNWIGYVCPAGYGDNYVKGKRTRAHKLVYELLARKVPKGLVLDHLCRNKRCVNPNHLEPVTQKENVKRGVPYMKKVQSKTCTKGHLLSGTNLRTFINKSGNTARACRSCAKERSLNRSLKNKV